jgi:threonyl-tRNA synthetase
VRLSRKDEESGGMYVADEKWTKATNALRNAMVANKVAFFEEPGAAAFCGPKADFFAKDALGVMSLEAALALFAQYCDA